MDPQLQALIAQLQVLIDSGKNQQATLSTQQLAGLLGAINTQTAQPQQPSVDVSKYEQKIQELTTQLGSYKTQAEQDAIKAVQQQVLDLTNHFNGQLEEQKLLNQKEKIIFKLGIDEIFQDQITGKSPEELLTSAQQVQARQKAYEERMEAALKERLGVNNQQNTEQNQQNQQGNQQNQQVQAQQQEQNDGQITPELIAKLPPQLQALAQQVLTLSQAQQNVEPAPPSIADRSLGTPIGFDRMDVQRQAMGGQGNPGLGANPNANQSRAGEPLVDLNAVKAMSMKDYANPQTRQQLQSTAAKELQRLFPQQ